MCLTCVEFESGVEGMALDLESGGFLELRFVDQESAGICARLSLMMCTIGSACCTREL